MNNRAGRRRRAAALGLVAGLLFSNSGSETRAENAPADKCSNVILGTEGDDVLEGTDQDDCIDGLGGNDVIRAGNGNDVVRAGAGDDNVSGESGDDIIHGGPGTDRIAGDYLSPDPRTELERAPAGSDQIFGDEDADLLFGDKGYPAIGPGPGDLYGMPDEIHGGPGDDEISGGGDADTIFGDDGADSLYGDIGQNHAGVGSPGSPVQAEVGGSIGIAVNGRGGLGGLLGAGDTIYGGAGNDVLYGVAGADHLYGDDGDDELYGGEGADVLVGGSGTGDFAYRTDDDAEDSECENQCPDTSDPTRPRAASQRSTAFGIASTCRE